MGGPDAAGGEHIGVAFAQGIERPDDRRLVIGNDAHFLQVDALERQEIRQIADVPVLGAAGQEFVANGEHRGGNGFRHGGLKSKQICAVLLSCRSI